VSVKPIVDVKGWDGVEREIEDNLSSAVRKSPVVNLNIIIGVSVRPGFKIYQNSPRICP